MPYSMKAGARVMAAALVAILLAGCGGGGGDPGLCISGSAETCDDKNSATPQQ
jgi:hypothetical protein